MGPSQVICLSRRYNALSLVVILSRMEFCFCIRGTLTGGQSQRNKRKKRGEEQKKEDGGRTRGETENKNKVRKSPDLVGRRTKRRRKNNTEEEDDEEESKKN